MIGAFIRRAHSVLPIVCVVCGLSANRDFGLCRDCARDLPAHARCCDRCGIDIVGRQSENGYCNSCLLTPPSFDICRAAFPYVSPIDKLVASFKFSAGFDIGYSMARVLAATFNAYYGESSKPQLLIPVPLHRSRLLSRGFNQAEEICNVLARHCGVAIATSIVCKTRNTEAQTAMGSAAARRRNLRGAFALRNTDTLRNITHIALVDDVVTTMATCNTVSRLVKSQQDCKIDLWCLARAQR